jgi:hypothetical protein
MVEAVGELLARLDIDPSQAETEELAHNRWLTPGVWRVSVGSDFQAVLKYTSADRSRGETRWDSHWTDRDTEPDRWTYWLREPLAYRDGLSDAYAGSGICAPECLAALVDEHEAILLVKWVDGIPGESWPIGTYAVAAEAAGRAQAAFLCGRPRPRVDWLSSAFLREYSSEKPVDWSLLDDDDAWRHPAALETFPAGLREAVTLLHASRERLYEVSEALPRTLCHLDYWPKNLFLLPDGEIAVIDWSFVGDGAIGEDVGNLVPDAALDHFVAADDLAELDEVVFDGYLRGLRSAGWTGDQRLVRLGMWSAAVKYDWLAPFTLAGLRSARQYRYGSTEEVDPAYRFGERSRVLLFNARRAEQALELASALGF